MKKQFLLATERGRELLSLAKMTVREKIREVQSQKGEAAEVGGNAWHDNFSFESLVEQERVLQAELVRLNTEFESLKIIGEPIGTNTLQIGHLATIEFENGSTAEYEVVGYGEGDMKAKPAKIVYQAPIIKDLFGCTVDTEAEVILPGGKQIIVLAKIAERPRKED